MFKKSVIGTSVVLVAFVGILFIPPFDHIRNFIAWGKHSIFDFRTHPTRLIENGNAPQMWPQDSLYNKIAIPDSLLAQIDSNNTHAFLVIQNGKLLYEKYYDGYTKDSISGSFSAAKSIISMLVGIGLGEGKIKSLDEPVGNYVAHFKEGNLAKIRIKDLLTMSSGTNYLEGDKSYTGLAAKLYYADDEEYVVNLMEAKEPAGVNWEYRSGDTQVLGLVVEKAFGKSISALTSTYFMQPMGAENDAKWLLDGDKKHEKAFCCFNGVARDYARFGELMLSNGKWKGKQLVPEDYMKAATSPASYLKDPTEGGKSVDFYGYQFWLVNHRGMAVPSMNGLFGQYVYAIREKNAIIVRLGETKVVKYVHHYQPENFTYIDAAMSILK
ncbi:6-aminohexanoate-dimer hydrolase [Emticicia aquatica]|jgi:CubicO group peptidase (beta-lactamase class C family)|uniref:6-aminohexanoate-dimer hydrolase n=1 Tax=Emticicia aquatica TaxID=1681835 RepID=A0ABM9AR99_9BACT|nr:serine hydrolase [Emticicia aquatica]CAH0996266.1 6-aminohexanoate-dimer hydrolase [Emticicia aquatica]